MRDDAALDAGGPRAITEHALANDTLLDEKLLQAAGGFIVPDNAKKFGGHPERGEIARDVRRAAGHEALALEFNDGHGRLGRDAAHRAPDKLVEHQIANHQDARVQGALQDLADALEGKIFHGSRNPVSGLVGLAVNWGEPRPTSNAVRPASTARANATAMRFGSCATAMAVF